MGSKASDRERRHEERMRRPRVKASCVRLDMTYPFGASNVASTLLDVSTGGARIVSTKPLEEGEPVSIRLDAPNRRRSVSMPGEVRWIEPAPAGHSAPKSYVAGVRFMRVPGVLELLLKS